jgi:hypothetical protein
MENNANWVININMKRILQITACLLLLSCSTKKAGIAIPAVTLTSDCAKNAECSLKIFPYKSMNVKTDEFGRLYYEMVDNPEKNVIQYNYNKIVKGDIQDAGYREELVFEANQNGAKELLSESTPQNPKMLFGRFCFCKGQTGYYKVEKSDIAVSETDHKLKTVALGFTVDDVPQITKSITFAIK